MIAVIVLGSGAGGGFPQWNSNAAGCQRARAGDPLARPRTQCSVAVSADHRHWFLLNASPDLRVQIECNGALHPGPDVRYSPIAGVVLAGAEVDAIAGLLTLREAHRFGVYATVGVLAVLAQNPIFQVLSASLVTRSAVPIDRPQALTLPDGTPSGLSVEMIAVPGKPPLYSNGGTDAPADAGATGVAISDGTSQLLFIPGCAGMTDALKRRIARADCLMFDGTLWQDDEMIVQGLGTKTGRAMGHMSLDGADGVLAALADVPVGRRVLLHINNSNPVLLADSTAYARVHAADWQIATDGMAFTL